MQALKHRRKDHPTPFRRSLSYDTSFDAFDIADVANSSVFRFTDALSSEDESPSLTKPLRKKEISTTKTEEPVKPDPDSGVSSRRKHRDLGPTLRFIPKESLLDSTITGSSFRGFVNLMIMMLVLSNLRLVIMNIQKYGFLIDFPSVYIGFMGDPYSWPSVSAFSIMVLLWIPALYIQVAREKKGISEKMCSWMMFAVIFLELLVPTFFIVFARPNPAPSIINMMISTCFVLKLVSYAVVNWEKRTNDRSEKARTSSRRRVRYPDNLNLRDIFYFAIAPCLVYDLNFPRERHFRLGFFMKCLLKFVLLSAVVIAIVEQYILPIIKGAMRPMERNDQWSFLERLLLLSIPNLVVWILGFYVFFHLWLNMFAELLGFADRRLVVFLSLTW
eukprot:TRINITY_DN1235_c0_g1_i2.p1 TRINITY_DN1235_c0_g1~~TRINITY_DN1235_c0_g1_i2.p1  ORF type:complete len:402 (+),score=64.09 TRINITY_DN1235_c0_g1_i2:44-1207(+)